MRWLCLGIALCCGCGFAGSSSDDGPGDADAGVDGDRFPSGHRFRKAIDLAPQGVLDPIQDFVVGLQTTADADLAAAARRDGADLLVTTADGTPLASEIELFDPATGQLAMWVRLPLLSGQPTRLYLYYGDESPAESAGDVWPESRVAVFHGNTAGDQAVDSSISGLVATADGSQLATEVSGVLGAGLGFEDGTAGYEIANPAPLRFGDSSFTYSIWVRVTQSLGASDMPWYHGGSASADIGYDLELGTGSWRAGVSPGEVENPEFGTETDLGGAWTQLVVVVDRGAQEVRVYANGEEADSRPLSTDLIMPSTLPRIGGPATSPFVGRLDELRVVRGLVSENAIHARYANLTDPDFVTFGEQETP